MQDAVIIFFKSDYRVSPTYHTSEDLSSQAQPAANRQEQPEPTTTENTASITGSDSPRGAVTPILLSLDALSEDPIPLKGCVLWNRRAFMVRIVVSAEDKLGRPAWSREKQTKLCA